MTYGQMKSIYNIWCEKNIALDYKDPDVADELSSMNDEEIEDAFYRELSFGTGGLRGVIGAGTNRMNVHTVARASQGVADYVIKKNEYAERAIAVSFDSRIKSHLFANIAASVFAANDVKVYLYPELMPTPCLSYAVRYLHCAAGIMVTASHNPSKYNGYKVYGSDGCQITAETAKNIFAEIQKLNIFDDIKYCNFEKSVKDGLICYISEDVYTAFVEEVKNQSVLFGDDIDRDVSIVYSPLNGTGLKPVLRTLKETGFANITVVKEQEKPNGEFPTCPFPNPEIKEAMALGIEYAVRVDAELLIATDPDCDRVGIAVKDETAGGMRLLSGNETGILLLDYICSQRLKHGKMPETPIFVKTIVTSNLAEQIAATYGVRTKNVLTGFKYIGEQIGMLADDNKIDSYVFGFEESYGYLSGVYVRDKDAVNGAFLICEMFAYYKTRGIGLLEKLNSLYEKYGYCLNTLHSYEFEGSTGFAKMQKIMEVFHNGIHSFAGKKVLEMLDYNKEIDGLPKSDVLEYKLDDNCSVIIRPSGTEPKLKVYVNICADKKEDAMREEAAIMRDIKKFFS